MGPSEISVCSGHNDTSKPLLLQSDFGMPIERWLCSLPWVWWDQPLWLSDF